jgi:GTP-binding protein LepA
VKYDLPLSRNHFNFFDKLKSATKGYASLDYELAEYRPSDLAKMDILLNGDVIDAFRRSSIARTPITGASLSSAGSKRSSRSSNSKCQSKPRSMAKWWPERISRAFAKTSLAKCYGGDISRKKKLLEKQKEGKKRMKAIGSVDVPQEAFMSMLSLDDDK